MMNDCDKATDKADCVLKKFNPLNDAALANCKTKDNDGEIFEILKLLP